MPELAASPRTHVVTAHQPAYLPWLGYFHRIAQADTFVFLDDVQFEKNSFTNRNRIKTQTGPTWLTIPVVKSGHTSSTMMTTAIDDRGKWRRKHLASIQQAYRHAPHFNLCYPRLEQLYAQDDGLLKDVCWRHLQFWLEVLGIDTKLVRLHELALQERKSDLVLALCKTLGAGTYISGPFGQDYLDAESFRQNGIAVEFDRFTPTAYPQLHGEFVPNLAIVDGWMNMGDQVSTLLAGNA